MAESRTSAGQRQLRQIVVEASRALATLDAGRLEELALSCQALNRGLPEASREERAELARQAADSARDMAIFARVLQVTRDNLKVMNRLRSLHADRLEYGDQLKQAWSPEEGAYGDH